MAEAAGIAYSVTHGGGPEDGLPPLILIHGAGGNRWYWPPQIRRLRGWRVYALDLPGHGASPPGSGTSIDDYAQAVLRWMEAMEIPRAAVAGHSMGSAVALTLAMEHAQRVAALVLVGSGARLRVNADLLSLTASPVKFPHAVDLITRWSFSREAPERLVKLAHERMLQAAPAVLHADLAACDAFDPGTRLASITAPALILCGSEDRMTPVALNEALCEALPNAQLELVDGAGHMAMLEQPEQVAERVGRFLRERVAAR